MSIEDNMENIASALDNIMDRMDPVNDFGSTVGDELNALCYQVSRVADALEAVVKHMQEK